MAPELLAVNASFASAAAVLRPIQRKLMPPPDWGSKVVFRFATCGVPSLHVGGMLFFIFHLILTLDGTTMAEKKHD